ncbi:transcriptional regulator, PadR family [Geomicrobium sp. JCM 19038]|nr:transcriptional regulator, PadR family [Geomicrobium sp. JCM 19038]
MKKRGYSLDKEMMKGNIDLILLSLIAKKDLYGYEMTKKLRSISDESYQMSEGTLYPSLKRMEKKAGLNRIGTIVAESAENITM